MILSITCRADAGRHGLGRVRLVTAAHVLNALLKGDIALLPLRVRRVSGAPSAGAAIGGQLTAVQYINELLLPA